MDKTQAKKIGIAEYAEFCELWKGKKYADADSIVKANNLTYGALKPEDEFGMLDINYKHILATIQEKGDGSIRVCSAFEVYDDAGQWLNLIKI